MCGIGGIVRFDGAPVQPSALWDMARALRHRGPDARAIHLDGSAGFAHTRLSVIDPRGGGQPMRTADGRYTIVYNGEVYRHAELRRALEPRGHRFRTRCDTEAVLLGCAGMVELARRLTPGVIAGILDLAPDAWLEGETSDPGRARSAYRQYFTERLSAPRAFVEEAIRVRGA